MRWNFFGFFAVSALCAATLFFPHGVNAMARKKLNCRKVVSFFQEPAPWGNDPNRWVERLSVSPKDALAMVESNSTFFVIDLTQNRVVSTYKSTSPLSDRFIFLSQDSYFVNSAGIPRCKFVKVENGTATVKYEIDDSEQVQVDPAKHYVAVLRSDPNETVVDFLNLSDLSLRKKIPLPLGGSSAHHMKFTPDGRRLIITYDLGPGKNGYLSVSTDDFTVRRIDSDRYADAINFDPTGRWLSIGSTSLYDISSEDDQFHPAEIGSNLHEIEEGDLFGYLKDGALLFFSEGAFRKLNLATMTVERYDESKLFPSRNYSISLLHARTRSGEWSGAAFTARQSGNDRRPGLFEDGEIRMFDFPGYLWVSSDQPRYLYREAEDSKTWKSTLTVVDVRTGKVFERSADDIFSFDLTEGDQALYLAAKNSEGSDFSLFKCDR